MLPLLLFVAALAALAVFGVVPLVLAVRLKAHAAAGTRRLPVAGAEGGAGQARCAVILPCRGLEPGLEDNLRAVLAQDFPACEVLLATTAGDASLPLLSRLAAEEPSRVRVVLAPRSTTCAQKLANQLAAVASVSPSVGTLAFVDSDGRLPPHFLRELVRPLDAPGVGLATGWRWYLPERRRFWSYVRSAWNAGAMPFLVDNRHNIAFGGAMAIRRAIFERSGAAVGWRQALSDGLSLARAVKGLGLEVRFAPKCIAVSREGGSLREVLEWTNRQVTISHVYMPEFWRFTALAHAASILVLALAVAAGCWAAGWAGAALAGGLYLGLLGANALLMVRTVAGMLEPGHGAELRARRGEYLAAAPAAAWLYGLNILRSALSRRIVWRGIAYEMASPTETRVLASQEPGEAAAGDGRAARPGADRLARVARLARGGRPARARAASAAAGRPEEWFGSRN